MHPPSCANVNIIDDTFHIKKKIQPIICLHYIIFKCGTHINIGYTQVETKHLITFF